jgi:hypothetical protein
MIPGSRHGWAAGMSGAYNAVGRRHSDHESKAMRRTKAFLFSLFLAVRPCVCADEPEEVIARSENPAPSKLPTLSVERFLERDPDTLWVFLSAAFPDPPGYKVRLMMYEIGRMHFIGAAPLAGGRMELRHRYHPQPGFVVVTVVTPERGAVEVVARLAPAPHPRGKTQDGLEIGEIKIRGELNPLNICCGLEKADDAKSKPDPYPEFVKRCFIFTEKGRTFLHETRRQPDQRRKLDDVKNNPPWIQRYLKVGREVPDESILLGKSWIGDEDPTVALNTTDRFTQPVIGTVSRDGKYLVAVGNGSATRMAQAWKDCVHNNPAWLPADAPLAKRRWRLKVYVMENDPAALLERVAKDFPEPRAETKKTGGTQK